MLAIQKKSVKAGKQVNTEHVNNVIRNYKKERWLHNSKHIGKEDSLSIWYSLEELEEFLAKAKQHGADGIKMYFGAYDKEHAPTPVHAERQTIVLVATRDRDTDNGTVTKDLYVNTEKGTSILAYNVGRPCPPICNTTEDDAIGITILDKGADGMIIA